MPILIGLSFINKINLYVRKIILQLLRTSVSSAFFFCILQLRYNKGQPVLGAGIALTCITLLLIIALTIYSFKIAYQEYEFKI